MKQGNIIIRTIQGNITKMVDVETTMNVAISLLLEGNSVYDAIQAAAGGEFLEECRMLNGCAIREARITGA